MLDTRLEKLVTSALREALLAHRPAPCLVVHFDRGGQYCANAYRDLLNQHGCWPHQVGATSAWTTRRPKTA